MLLFLLLTACSRGVDCADRADDADCDGVPDDADRCSATPASKLVDRQGCSENEAAGCVILPELPADGARVKGAATITWSGTCELTLVQLSDDPSFPPARTRTVARTRAEQAQVEGTEAYWRLVGGLSGHSAGYSTEPRRIRWR